MINYVLLYIASLFLVFWGVAHLFPTKSVVNGFGDISIDNKRIITMEWIIEGIALIFIGIVVSSVTYIDHAHVISKTVYRLSFLMLSALTVISLFTGTRINFLPYKLCPVIFISASILIILGCYL
jgi:hypothetical protein